MCHHLSHDVFIVMAERTHRVLFICRVLYNYLIEIKYLEEKNGKKQAEKKYTIHGLELIFHTSHEIYVDMILTARNHK